LLAQRFDEKPGLLGKTPKGYNNCSLYHNSEAIFCLREPVMAKSKKKAESIFLVCEETGDYNYTLRRKPGGEKL
jgi:hypothetical protein